MGDRVKEAQLAEHPGHQQEVVFARGKGDPLEKGAFHTRMAFNKRVSWMRSACVTSRTAESLQGPRMQAPGCIEQQWLNLWGELPVGKPIPLGPE